MSGTRKTASSQPAPDAFGFQGRGLSGWVGNEPDTAPPDPERVVSDIETLRALADPLRLRILETMVTRAHEAWSVKELAAALGVPQTRLYHHIELLLERDLVRPAAQRLVSGIVETRYRVTALSLRLDPKLLSSDEEATTTLVANILETARTEILAAVRTTPPDPANLMPDRPLISRGLARLTPKRAGELRERLVALLDEFDHDGERPGAVPYGLLLAFYPASTPQGDES
jgi:DNA-binding transcriptional ArsR family regulator